MAMSEEEYAEIIEHVDTHTILEAVDKFDSVRELISDGRNGEPPIFRCELIRLHSIGMDFINRGHRGKAHEFFDLANELSDQLFDAQGALDEAWRILDRICAAYPEGLMDA